MGEKTKRRLVKYGQINDLPEFYQTSVMNAHKIVVDKIHELLNDPKCIEIKNSNIAMSAIDEFCLVPGTDKDVGKVTLSKYGNEYECMIQLTGHFRHLGLDDESNKYIGELTHAFIREVYGQVKNEIKEKCQLRLENECGDSDIYEGFDVYPNSVIAKEMWNNDWFDKEEITLKESVDYYDEASHGTLKYDFRLGWDYDTGHQIKVVYSLDNIDITGIGDFYWKGNKENRNSNGTLKQSEDEYKNWVKKNITKKGNNDHQSKGQKVLAIIDLVNNKRLNEVKLINPFCPGINTHSKSLTLNELKIVQDNVDINSKYLNVLKVGDIDNNESFKATSWGKNTTDLKTLEDFRFNQISKKEFLKSGRGYKINDIIPDDLKIFEYSEKPPIIFNNPNKKEALIELNARAVNYENLAKSLINALNNNIYPNGWDKESVLDFLNLTRQKIQIIDNDINTINTKGYDLSIMQKYREEDNNNRIFKYNKMYENSDMKMPIDMNSLSILAERSINREMIEEFTTKEEIEDITNIDVENENDLKEAIGVCKQKVDNFSKKAKKNIDKTIEQTKELQKKYGVKSNFKENTYDYEESVYTESTMTSDEKEAKKTLKTLSAQLIRDLNNEEKKKNMTQYTANIYANIITKNLLKIWAPGYRKLTIVLDSYQSFYTFEFKVPTMSQDFISRFVAGRESIQGFLHRTPEIKIKMSPRIFHTMENPDDAFHFFKAAITYYDSKIEKYSISLMTEIMRLDRGLKHLISTTKLSGLVTFPMMLLFQFEDVHMNNKKTFEISKDNIKTVNQFVKNISTRYAAPEKEKKAIINDVKDMIKSLQESSELDINLRALNYLPEEIKKYYEGGYEKEIKVIEEQFASVQINRDWECKQANTEIKYLQEKFGVKKLKKIPVDLIAYIQIETESIKDANDKMMISSYCLGKLEIVEWYIELLEVGSKKYIVPHTKQYLDNMRTQLLACFKKIMDTKVTKPGERPVIDIQYPKGYEG